MQSGDIANHRTFQALYNGFNISTIVRRGKRTNVGCEETIEYFDGRLTPSSTT